MTQTIYMRDEAGEPVVLRGVAVPYREHITVNGVAEHFDAGAFAGAGRGLVAAPLQWSHSDGAMVLAPADLVSYVDGHWGLMFEARLPASPFAAAAIRLANAGDLKCSVCFEPIATSADGGVRSAFLHHVSLGVCACYETAAWVEDSVTRYPRLSPLATVWRRRLKSQLRDSVS